jgi:soluble lytic murein transglycosylase
MKFLKKIFSKLIIVVLMIVAVVVVARYIVKESFFPYKYQEYVDACSTEYNLDPLFVLAVIKTESKFDDDAHSHKNAVGLMQITIETGEWAATEMKLSKFSKDDLYDEEYNIRMGCWYLRRLNDTFEGDLDLTIAAYNAGPTNVKKWLEDEKYSSNGKSIDYIPFGETKKYVDKVDTYYHIYQYLYSEEESYLDVNKILELIKGFLKVQF